MNIDANEVIQSLGQKISQLEVDNAVKDVYIRKLEKDIAEIKESMTKTEMPQTAKSEPAVDATKP
ncbi:hypothetical protein EV207_101174 [Scopulibacillus darangshiensis]|uniref:Uncharacterized protein n=1 Tax=Scopulibacillus darangshiensis TaxID=442528 RepID=A0A4V2SNR6_9BACL|nr:hypothetical protein [Scopulibacillus darangshiensis]TCP32196.1 hypothetical protein EV207_101174 [Scopulibacillus darangshiensis]